MKNKIFLSLIAIIFIGGISTFVLFKNQHLKEAEKFKNEYEILNGKINENNNKEYKNLTISKNNPIIYADFNKIMEILDGTGIIYFGFPECPWCRTAIPALLETAKETGLKEIYYFNNLDSRDIRKLDNNGKIIIEKEGTPEYYQLLEKLGPEFTEEYSGLNDSNLRRLYFPTVIAVKDGKILKSVAGTVDSQDDPYLPLTNNQETELKTIYKEIIQEILR